MLATLMGPDATILRARRDENALRRRRPGTGRTTTKRSFGLKLPTALHGLIGRKTGLPLKENVARDVHNLDDVGAFWRDSLEGGLVDKTAASPPTAPIPDPADDLQMKEVQDGAVSATPKPAPQPEEAEPVEARPPAAVMEDTTAPHHNDTQALNPFQRANRLMRTPAGPSNSARMQAEPEEEPEQPEVAPQKEAAEEPQKSQEDEWPAPRQEAAFRRANKLPRTPAAGAPAERPTPAEQCAPAEPVAEAADVFKPANKLMRTPAAPANDPPTEVRLAPRASRTPTSMPPTRTSPRAPPCCRRLTRTTLWPALRKSFSSPRRLPLTRPLLSSPPHQYRPWSTIDRWARRRWL